MTNSISEDSDASDSPGPSVTPEPVITYTATPFLPPGLLAAVSEEFSAQYDVPDQGWAFGLKYLDADSVEYASLLPITTHLFACAFRARSATRTLNILRASP
jgi:hypothetical protein